MMSLACGGRQKRCGSPTIDRGNNKCPHSPHLQSDTEPSRPKFEAQARHKPDPNPEGPAQMAGQGGMHKSLAEQARGGGREGGRLKSVLAASMGRNGLFMSAAGQFYPASLTCATSKMQHPSGGDATQKAHCPMAVMKNHNG